MAKLIVLSCLVAFAVLSDAFKISALRGMDSKPSGFSDMDWESCPVRDCVQKGEEHFWATLTGTSKRSAMPFGGNIDYKERRGMIGGFQSLNYFQNSQTQDKRQVYCDRADMYSVCKESGEVVYSCVSNIAEAEFCNCPPRAIVGTIFASKIPKDDLIAGHCDMAVYQGECQDSNLAACVQNGMDMVEGLMAGNDVSDNINAFKACKDTVANGDTTGCTWTKFVFGPMHQHIVEVVTAANAGCDMEAVFTTCGKMDEMLEFDPCTVDIDAEFSEAVSCVSDLNTDGKCSALLANKDEDLKDIKEFVNDHLCPLYKDVTGALDSCGYDAQKFKEKVGHMIHEQMEEGHPKPPGPSKGGNGHGKGPKHQQKKMFDFWNTA